MKLLLLIIMVALVSCEQQETSETTQNKKQEEMNRQAVQSVGMPSIVNFSEKRHLKDILELRDKSSPTITYVRDMNGRLHKVCSSIGFGIPNSTQFTNPQKVSKSSSAGYAIIPQADPNGLYSGSSEATWVLCLHPKSGKIAPTYLEDRVTVSTFEME